MGSVDSICWDDIHRHFSADSPGPEIARELLIWAADHFKGARNGLFSDAFVPVENSHLSEVRYCICKKTNGHNRHIQYQIERCDVIAM